MREIKFRLFGNGKMFEPFLLDNEFDCINGWITDRVIMQYTGLKDKNGKEIYEGDILYVEFEKSRSLNHFDMYLKQWKHEVKWVGQGFNIPNIDNEFRQTLCTAIHNQNKPTPEWEIIGNIYENPELLK